MSTHPSLYKKREEESSAMTISSFSAFSQCLQTLQCYLKLSRGFFSSSLTHQKMKRSCLYGLKILFTYSLKITDVSNNLYIFYDK